MKTTFDFNIDSFQAFETAYDRNKLENEEKGCQLTAFLCSLINLKKSLLERSILNRKIGFIVLK